jgi:phage gp29-like protein
MMGPDTTQHVEPSHRTWVDWTPARVKAAERMADAGNLRLAAELCDALLADDRVQGALGVRARGLLGLPFSFEPGVGRRRRAGVKYLEAEEDFDAAYPEEQLARFNAWGILLGVAPAQNLWTERANGRVIPVIDPWHPRGLRHDGAAEQWYMNTADAGEVPITPGDGRWLLYTPSGTKRPWSYGAWRAVARWWLLKQYAVSDWGVQGERARGILAAKPPSGTTDAPAGGDTTGRAANRFKLAELLRDAARNAALVLPAGYDLELVQAAANTYETYRAQIDMANAGIAIALTGQNLTTEVKGGSHAAAEVHKSVANVLLRSDGQTLPTCLHDQAIAWWAEFNLGNRAAAPWPFWDTTPPADLAGMTTMWRGAAEAVDKFRALGVDVDLDEVCRQVGIPVRAPAADPKPAR